MQELKQAYAKWRKILLRTNIYLVICAFFVELLMFFVLKKLDLILQPLPEYFKWFLLAPTIANLLIILTGEILLKRMAPDSKAINYIPIVQLAGICTVLACIHNVFSVTLCFFCFPLFMTAIFGDKKMLNNIAILCFLFMTCTLFYRKFAFYNPKNDIYFLAEAIVAYVVLFATFTVSRVLINFQEEKTQIINNGYQHQLEMQDQLNKDQKTGLYGQTIFNNTLNHMVEISGTTNKTILLAVIDIDDFKKINDTYGHLKGDQIILTLSEVMKTVFNEHFISRFGGEEFAIIFSESEIESAVVKLEELRTKFEKINYIFMEDTVTISIGIAIWQKGWTAEQLFEAADSAMYSAKNSGKNRTMVYI